MPSNSYKTFQDGLHLDTSPCPIASLKAAGADPDTSTLAAYSTEDYQYPSTSSSATLDASTLPGTVAESAWTYDSLSAHSESAMASASWVDSYGTMPTLTGNSASAYIGWDPLNNPYSAYPTDDSESSFSPFSTVDSAMLDATTSQPDSSLPSTYCPYYPILPLTLSSGSSSNDTTSPQYTSSASSPSARGPSPSPRVNKPRSPQQKRVKSNPKLRVKRSVDTATTTSATHKRKQDVPQKQQQQQQRSMDKNDSLSQSLYPGDLKTPENTLMMRYSHHMTLPAAPTTTAATKFGEFPTGLITPEHIRREAWRVCEAEAREMSERRMKLLEHEGGALERETARLQISVSAMRDAVGREHAELWRAVEMAEKLASGRD